MVLQSRAREGPGLTRPSRICTVPALLKALGPGPSRPMCSLAWLQSQPYEGPGLTRPSCIRSSAACRR